MSGTQPKKLLSSKKKKKVSIAIITIYRDNQQHSRLQQKNKFLAEISKLKKYGYFDVFLIEQTSDNCKFNIGKLKNIGFQKALQSEKNYQFFIFTDIDILPNKELAPYFFKPIKGVSCLATRGTRYKYQNCFMGSCLGFDKRSFQKINGYPNNFWGWGGEDDAILIRCNLNKINIHVPREGSVIDLETNHLGRARSLKDKLESLRKSKTKETNKNEKEILETKIWRTNGLSNLDYQIISSSCSYQDNYILYHYLVDLNYSQDHLQHTDWFDISSYVNLPYTQLKKITHKNLKRYKKCSPKFY